MTEILEDVRFRTLPGTEPAAFVAAAAVVTPWLQARPGFRYRCLVDLGDEGWMDECFWASLEQAEAAASAFMAEFADSPFLAMIDPASLSMAHRPIRLSAPGG